LLLFLARNDPIGKGQGSGNKNKSDFMPLLKDVTALGISYSLGCFLTGYFLVRIRAGQDIRQYSSGSAGATNVGRLLGRPCFYLTLLGDVAKGFLALLLSHTLSQTSWIGVAAMFSVVAGHIWPLPFGLRGGKGVATSLGALIGYDWRLGLLTLVLFALIFLLTRKRTLSIFVGILCCPILALLLHHTSVQQAGLWSVVLLLAFAHRDNLRSLFSSQPKAPLEESEGD
jgi:glycerol-3-phosphate acyltransferase PlsY